MALGGGGLILMTVNVTKIEIFLQLFDSYQSYDLVNKFKPNKNVVELQRLSCVVFNPRPSPRTHFLPNMNFAYKAYRDRCFVVKRS